MNLWRICSSNHQATAFSGYGAEKTGGRWNNKGFPVVYTSENLSLATLELFVHISPGMMPEDLIWMRASLPDSISARRIDAVDLPKNWREYPAHPELQTMGTEWIIAKSSLILVVPSAINPQESNILLNPAHPEIHQLKLEAVAPFRFDSRMFGK